jgi:glycosyltransferase involved in cell wall biosynthesis
VMVSLAQFRPEKDHAKQVEALALLFERHPEWTGRGVRLVLMGSCRNEEDERRIRGLEELADRLGVRVSQSGMRIRPGADGTVCSGIYGIRRQCAVLRNRSAAGRGFDRVEHDGRRALWHQCRRIHGRSSFLPATSHISDPLRQNRQQASSHSRTPPPALCSTSLPQRHPALVQASMEPMRPRLRIGCTRS